MKNGSLILSDHYHNEMRIFLDTNILVKSYLVRNSNNKTLAHSLIRDFGSVHDFIVSDFVFVELQNVLPRYILDFDETSVLQLISYLGVQLLSSGYKDVALMKYVEDVDDLQILCDALFHKAILLVSENGKDFHKDEIEQDLGILVYSISDLIAHLKNE